MSGTVIHPRSLQKNAGKNDEAVATLQKGMKAFPNELALVIDMINIYLETGRETEAIDAMLKAIELDPKNHQLYFVTGVAYAKIKNNDKALEYYNKALEVKPDYSDAYNNIIIESINVTFKIASDLDEQGIADYLAGRDDAHKKLRWKLTSYLSPTQADSLGKSDAVQPISVDMTDIVVPAVEQLMKDADGCPLCGYGECMCPSSDGGVCLCDEDCACHNCHVVMDEESYTFQDQYFSFQEEQLDAMMAAGIIVAEEQDLAKALLEIAETHGKFNEDRTGIWAGYTPAAENEYKEIGVKCINCVLYEGPGVCKIIAQPIEDDGKCRFAVIPDGVV
jgi:tetratricopeptide (TPR) repeat protein